MVSEIRGSFNGSFNKEKYEAFLRDLNSVHPGAIEFRVAETPVFVSKDFTTKMLDACESIVDVITDPGFNEMVKNAVPKNIHVPGESRHSHFIAFDFGICINEAGEYEPQLIEMQGFPTLFAYEVLLDEVFRKHFPVPDNFSCYLGDHEKESYLQLLKDIIVADEKPENVILLEIFPHQQKTRIDFYCTQDYLGIKPVCLTELIKEGKKLFYMNEGKKTQVRRIYNRVIFDDLQQQTPEVQEKGKILFEELDVQWIPHPNWFYKISKYTIPFIHHPYVPKTFFLDEIKQIPTDLENYVLKPLFSFAGQGVVIDVTQTDIDNVKDPENWILQRKVKYADIIETPDIPAKAEIRLFYFWKDGAARPVAANNLARLSKGKMIGVRYNKDKEWVGGSFCYFEK
ncbi:MAG: circularly permuted type 2 ATP-grasp protein [Bacteroidetes bacterium]|nr:MAG: circularly permuted type 2 ATP-grasp protein [Bacteroidota bacterium]